MRLKRCSSITYYWLLSKKRIENHPITGKIRQLCHAHLRNGDAFGPFYYGSSVGLFIHESVFGLAVYGQQELSCCFSFQFTTAKENKARAKEERMHAVGGE